MDTPEEAKKVQEARETVAAVKLLLSNHVLALLRTTITLAPSLRDAQPSAQEYVINNEATHALCRAILAKPGCVECERTTDPMRDAEIVQHKVLVLDLDKLEAAFGMLKEERRTLWEDKKGVSDDRHSAG